MGLQTSSMDCGSHRHRQQILQQTKVQPAQRIVPSTRIFLQATAVHLPPSSTRQFAADVSGIVVAVFCSLNAKPSSLLQSCYHHNLDTRIRAGVSAITLLVLSSLGRDSHAIFVPQRLSFMSDHPIGISQRATIQKLNEVRAHHPNLVHVPWSRKCVDEGVVFEKHHTNDDWWPRTSLYVLNLHFCPDFRNATTQCPFSIVESPKLVLGCCGLALRCISPRLALAAGCLDTLEPAI